MYSSGLRGGIFWAGVFGLGHFAYLSFEQWRRERYADKKLRQLYWSNDVEQLRQYLPSEQPLQDGEKIAQAATELPSREQVVSWTWREFLADPMRIVRDAAVDLPDWLPLIHSKEQYEYREYLEAKMRLLETELDLMERIRWQRQREILKLEAQIDQSSGNGNKS